MAAVTTTINAALLDVGQHVESDARHPRSVRAIVKLNCANAASLALLAVRTPRQVVPLLATSFKFTGLPLYVLDKSLVDRSASRLRASSR